MKCVLFFLTLFFFFPVPAAAIYDPLSVSNNRLGVHVLSPDEIEEAAKLVNRQGQASWGYVTVPIQATDRDRDKWTRFMKKAAELKVIPIIRVATYAAGKNWLKPGNHDLIDFANFLNELPWPTQNRYVIIFNEVNRADEYGGTVSPEDYADILASAIDIFKSRSDKFFLLPAGLDNAAPNRGDFMRWDVYLTRMFQRQPEIFNRIDGWTSHAYGNPAFSASPALSGSYRADSFKSDLRFITQFTQKKLPVFITEAGWTNRLGQLTVANFYQFALTHLWSNDPVVAVTPFLLFADSGPFLPFSLLTANRQPTAAYQTLTSFAQDGAPLLEVSTTPAPFLALARDEATPTIILGASTFEPINLSWFRRLFDYLFRLVSRSPFTQSARIGGKTYHLETVTSSQDQAIGLTKYNRLEDDQGMLFKFKQTQTRSFWMKGMKFDIDIVWLKDGVVVGVTPGLAREPEKILTSPEPVDTVLEVKVNSGLKKGDQLKLQ